MDNSDSPVAGFGLKKGRVVPKYNILVQPVPVFCLFLFLFVVSSCVKNEITVEFQLPAEVNSVYRVIYYASDSKKGMMLETAAEVTAGKGQLKLPTRYPSVVYLFSPSSPEPALIFYAERGDKIKISASNQNIYEWKVDGNDVNREWTAWRIKNKEALAARSDERINDAVSAYVREHRESELSLVLLYLQYFRNLDPAGFRSLYSSLSPKVFDNKSLVSALSVCDLLDPPQLKPGNLDNLALMNDQGYADTLSFKDSDRALLVFYAGNNRDSRKEELQTIKKLASEYSDSTKSLIASIYSDTDSLQWKRSVEADSLKNVRQLWMPLGTVSPEGIKIGIPSLPYYIVAGPKGKRIYEGNNINKAAEAFRNAGRMK